jgi:ferritin-like metal-binding protein YciE
MEVDEVRRLYIDDLNDLYSAEKQIVRELPELAKTAHNPDLGKTISDHVTESERHIGRLERIFNALGVTPSGDKSRAIEWLMVEGGELLEEDADAELIDVTIITRAQHIERYEIAGYGTVRAYALMLGETEHAERLAETLVEERRAEERFTQLAERLHHDRPLSSWHEAASALDATR